MKKTLSLLLAIAMVLTMLPVAVFAEGAGTYQDPMIITDMGDYTITTEAGWYGTYMKFTATESGALSFTVNTESNWAYNMYNYTEWSGSFGGNCSEGAAATSTVEVIPGQEISIQIWAEDFTAASFDVTFSFEAYEIEAYTIIERYQFLDENYVPAPMDTAEIPAGETVKYKFKAMDGETLKITGENAYVIMDEVQYDAVDGVVMIDIVDPNYQGVYVYIGNAGTEAATYTMELYYAPGTSMNPETIEPGTYTKEFRASTGWNDDTAYYYTFTAPEDCKITLTINSEDNWEYFISNLSTYEGGSSASNEDEPVSSTTVLAYEGDVIQFSVCTAMSYETWTYPEGTVEFTFAWEACEIIVGTEDNPYVIYSWDLPTTVGEIAAGETAYVQVNYMGGNILAIEGAGAYAIMDGVTYEADEDGVVYVPIGSYYCMIQIGNNGTEAATYALSHYIPVGAQENPQIVTELGEYSAEITAGSYGYYFNWTAEEDGVLTFTMYGEENDGGWQYMINNMTTYVYGDSHNSSEDPIVDVYEVEVSAGDLIAICVCTYDAENPWSAPAGTIWFDLSFTAGAGEEVEATELVIGDNEFALPGTGMNGTWTATEAGTLTVTVSALSVYDEGSEDYTSVFPSMVMGRMGYFALYVNDETNFTETYTLDVTAGQEVNVSITNTFAYDAKGTMTLSFEAGSGEGDDEIESAPMADTDVALAADECITIVFTPETDGVLTGTISAVDTGWEFTITDKEYYQGTVWSDSDPNTISENLTAGTTYTITIYAYDEATWAYVAGTITYELTFTPEGGESTEPDGSEANPYIIESLPYDIAVSLDSENSWTGVFYQYTATEAGYLNAEYSGFMLSASVNGEMAYWPIEVAAGDVVVINPWATYAGDFTATVSFSTDAPGGNTEIETTEYENVATPTGYTLANGEITTWVDITTAHTAVLGEDGYYHLDSADGDIILVQMTTNNPYGVNLAGAVAEGRMKAPVVEDGETVAYLNFVTSVEAYIAAASDEGWVYLTEDLIKFFQEYGAAQGWYMDGLSFYLNGVDFDADTAWMLCCATVSEAVNPFVDVNESNYFYNPVMWAVANGITAGTDDTHFSPSKICTRAQVVMMLWKACGSPVVEFENPFTDVYESNYYYNAVMWAVANGITSGTGDGTTFSPAAECTRAQVVTFLYKAKGEPDHYMTENPFTDVAEGAYYYNAVLWAVENGITAGKTETTFEPTTKCTRAHIVTFLYNAFN